MNWLAVAIGGVIGVVLPFLVDIRTPAHDFGYAVGKRFAGNGATGLDFIVIAASGLGLAVIFAAVCICLARAVRFAWWALK